MKTVEQIVLTPILSIKRVIFLLVLESIKRAEPAKEEIMDESVLTSLR